MYTLYEWLSLLFYIYALAAAPPPCSDSIQIKCGDKHGNLNPNAQCLAADRNECRSIGLASSVKEVVFKTQDGKYKGSLFFKLGSDTAQVAIKLNKLILCGIAYRKPPNYLENVQIVQDSCAAETTTFTLPQKEWISKYLKEFNEKKETQNKEITNKNNAKSKEVHKKLEEIAKSFRKSMQKANSIFKLMPKKEALKIYKSAQQGAGDCVMHSINNVLGALYLSNPTVGVFAKRLLKIWKGDPTQAEQENTEKGRNADAVAIYAEDDKEFKGKILYYEALAPHLVKGIFKLFHVHQKRVAFDGDLYDEQDIPKLTKALRETRKFKGLLGLRFSYSPDWAGGHSVGIRFADRMGEDIGNRHWLYVQSWGSVPPMLFDDTELATYLFKAEVGHIHDFKKTLLMVLVDGDDEKNILPAPSKSIQQADNRMVYYWKCVLEEKDASENIANAISTCILKTNNYARASIEDNDNLYDDADENKLEELDEEIMELEELINLQQRDVNRLLRNYYLNRPSNQYYKHHNHYRNVD